MVNWSYLRVVNALLTQLDQIKMAPNVLILTTSNITGAIDGAFVDRADIVQYIGPPNQAAIYQILFSAIQVFLWVKVLTSLLSHSDVRSWWPKTSSSLKEPCWHTGNCSGVSIISKNWVFYKAWYERLEFSLREAFKKMGKVGLLDQPGEGRLQILLCGFYP